MTPNHREEIKPQISAIRKGYQGVERSLLFLSRRPQSGGVAPITSAPQATTNKHLSWNKCNSFATISSLTGFPSCRRCRRFILGCVTVLLMATCLPTALLYFRRTYYEGLMTAIIRLQNLCLSQSALCEYSASALKKKKKWEKWKYRKYKSIMDA